MFYKILIFIVFYSALWLPNSSFAASVVRVEPRPAPPTLGAIETTLIVNLSEPLVVQVPESGELLECLPDIELLRDGEYWSEIIAFMLGGAVAVGYDGVGVVNPKLVQRGFFRDGVEHALCGFDRNIVLE